MVLWSISAFLMLNSLIGMSYIPQEKSWYEKDAFMVQIIRKAGFVRDWIVRYEDQEIFSPKNITSEQIQTYKEKDNTIKDDEEAIATILKDRQAYFKSIETELIKENVNIEFLGINLETGAVVTNIAHYRQSNQTQIIEELFQRPGFVFGDGKSIIKTNTQPYREDHSYSRKYYMGDSFEGEETFAIYVAIADKMQVGDWFYLDKQEFDKRSAIKDNVYLFGIIGIVCGVILLAYWLRVVGQREAGGAIQISLIDKIPFELQFIGYSFSMFIWFMISTTSLGRILPKEWMPYTFNPSYKGEETMMFLLISIGVCITLLFVSSVLRHIKNHTVHKYIGVIRATRWVLRNLVREKTLPIAAVLAVGAHFIVNVMFIFIMLVFLNRVQIIFILAMILMLGFNILAAIGLLKLVLDYLKLLRASKQIAQGNLRTKIELQYALPVMNDMAHTINHIREGLEGAVENSLKSERLKTELITNVSHDLKTPLTSIISYIDLLKQEPIDNIAAKEYIQVLDERSNRLKQLVEDLVDASKAVTGNIKADLAPIELHQLVRQSVGEYTDRLEANGLTVIMNQVEEICILADGRHMYRILENLLSNVNKYAMPQTRVYIDIIKDREYGVFVIKNISKEYLNIDASELTKRFVRGDKARSSEGSGLGLAIAESLVKLQGGVFNNSIDGDLFKVEIKIPIC